MVNKTTAQKAVVAALSGMMALAPIAPAFAAREAQTKKSSNNTWTASDGTTLWTRLAGDNRYETMTKIIDNLYGSDGRGEVTYSILNTAILVSGEMYPDALAASTLSGAGYTIATAKGVDQDNIYPTPIIITKGDVLSDDAKDALDHLNILNVIILGGENTISKAIEDDLIDQSYNVERIAGADRSETSLKAAQYVETEKGSVSHIFIVSGDNYADAISAGPVVIGGNYRSDGTVASHKESATDVLLFAKNGVLTDAQVDFIEQSARKYGVAGQKYVFVIGGEASVSSTAFAQAGEAVGKYGLTVQRIAGADRYATSAAVATAFSFEEIELRSGRKVNVPVNNKVNGRDGDYDFLDSVVVATGETYPDALVGAPFAAYHKAPIVLVKESGKSGIKFLKQALMKYKADGTGFQKQGGWIISGEDWISNDFVSDEINAITK